MRLVDGMFLAIVMLAVCSACTNSSRTPVEKAPEGAQAEGGKQTIWIDDGYDDHKFGDGKDEKESDQGSVGEREDDRNQNSQDNRSDDNQSNNSNNNNSDNNDNRDPDGREIAEPGVVVFRIKDGTGRGDWNSEANAIRLKVGETVRVINEDSVTHQLHTNGAPCPP